MEAWSFDDLKLDPKFNYLQKELYKDKESGRFWPDEPTMYRLSTLIPGLGVEGENGNPSVHHENSIGMQKAYQMEQKVVASMNHKPRLAEFRMKYLKSFTDQYSEQYALFIKNTDVTDSVDVSKVPLHLLKSALKGDLLRALKVQFHILENEDGDNTKKTVKYCNIPGESDFDFLSREEKEEARIRMNAPEDDKMDA